MGCDIHVNVEYRHPVLGYQPVISGGYVVERRYELFAALAGVRTENGESSLIPARGFPRDACFLLFEQAHQLVVDHPSSPFAKYVADWILESDIPPGSVVVDSDQVLVGKTRWIQHPDYHGASFLSHSEIMDCLTHFGYDLSSGPPEFLVLIDLLASIDNRFGNQCSRLVFWFDN
ncbi:MAG: hypothetical protein ACF8AM_06455 [Rhodopirellula sp. JB055]|uniref:hypothetical protein n=1 Tax=Rhodopirellula sp. JB055 TaxID=3342846 RepID=UPI00370CBEFF